MNSMIIEEKCCGNCAMFEEAIPRRNDPSNGECKDRATVYLTSPPCDTYKKASWDLIKGRVHQIIKPWQQDFYLISKDDRKLTDGLDILVIEHVDMPVGIFKKWWYKITHRNDILYYHLRGHNFKGEVGDIGEFRVEPCMIQSNWHTIKP